MIERVYLCVGTLGPEQWKESRYQITYYTYLVSRWLSYTPSIERVGWVYLLAVLLSAFYKCGNQNLVSLFSYILALTSGFWKLFSMRVGSGHETTHFSILQVTKSWAGPGNKVNLCQLCDTDGLYICCGIPLCLGKVWQQPHWCSEEDELPPNTDRWPRLPLLPGACLQDSQVRDSDMVLPWFTLTASTA